MSTNKKTSIRVPKLTRPTTAYALLSKICKLITEEPKRYDQNDWFSSVEDSDYNKSQYPACGTICCVAGWVGTLVRSPTQIRTLMRRDPLCGVEYLGRRVLGLDGSTAYELFSPSALNLVRGDDPLPNVGTPEYAALGVKHIRAFQEKYKTQLKARVVTPQRRQAEGREGR